MTAALPRLAEYQLRHVWSTGTDADTSAYDHPSYSMPPGIQITGIGRSTHRAFGPPGTPACDNALPNYDSRYSPGGILGLFVGRGPETTFAATWSTDVLMDATDVLMDSPTQLMDGRADFRLFTGNIDTAPQSIDSPMASVQVRSLGRISLLNDQSPLIPLSEGIRTDQAVTLILDACGWDADARVIDTGDTTLLYFWGDGRTSAITLINQLVGAEGVPACAYEDGQGRFHFEGRQFRANNPASSEVQWYLFDGTYGTNNPIMDDPLTIMDDPNTFMDGPVSALLYHIVPAQWSANPDEVVKSVSATVNVRTPSSLGNIWEYGGPLVLAANEVRDLYPTASDPFKTATVPVSGTDYSISAGSPLASITLLATSGVKVTLRLVAPASGCTVIGVTSNGIQLRAVALPVTNTNPVTSTVNTDLAAARYRPRDHTLNLWPEITANQALDHCNSFARRYQRPRDQMTVQMVNIDWQHLYAMLHMAPSDRVRVRHQRAGINAAFFIESLSHDLTAGGGLHRLVLNLERVTDDVPSVFGTARFGFDVFSGA